MHSAYNLKVWYLRVTTIATERQHLGSVCIVELHVTVNNIVRIVSVCSTMLLSRNYFPRNSEV